MLQLDYKFREGIRKEIQVFKKRFLIVAIVLALLVAVGTATVAVAAGPKDNSSSAITIPLFEGDEVTIEKPLAVTLVGKQWFSNLDEPLFPGERIVRVSLVVTNQGRISYGVRFSVIPEFDGEFYPSFDLRVSEKGVIYPDWKPIVIAPGTKKEIRVEVSVAFRSPPSTLSSLYLAVQPVPPAEEELAGKG